MPTASPRRSAYPRHSAPGTWYRGVALDPHQPRILHRLQSANFLHHVFTDLSVCIVDVYCSDGAGFVPAQGKVGDVDAVLTQNRADLAVHAGLIVVHEEDRGSRQWRFQRHTVKQHEAWAVARHHGPLDVA